MKEESDDKKELFEFSSNIVKWRKLFKTDYGSDVSKRNTSSCNK